MTDVLAVCDIEYENGVTRAMVMTTMIVSVLALILWGYVVNFPMAASMRFSVSSLPISAAETNGSGDFS